MAARAARIALALGATAVVGCSAIIDEELKGLRDGGNGDLSEIDLAGLDARPKAPRLDVKIFPQKVSPEQEITLTVIAFNFRLVPLDEPPHPGWGHYLVSFLRHDEAISLLESSGRETRFRLADFPQIRPLEAGERALRIELRMNDGTVVAPEAVVELPLMICDEDQGCPP